MALMAQTFVILDVVAPAAAVCWDEETLSFDPLALLGFVTLLVCVPAASHNSTDAVFDSVGAAFVSPRPLTPAFAASVGALFASDDATDRTDRVESVGAALLCGAITPMLNESDIGSGQVKLPPPVPAAQRKPIGI